MLGITQQTASRSWSKADQKLTREKFVRKLAGEVIEQDQVPGDTI